MELNLSFNIDKKASQEKVNQYAQQGAEKAIMEYFTSYNSPYTKAIKESLEASVPKNGYKLDLPDLMSLINEAMSSELNGMANKAVAQTFIPMISNIASAPKKINFSEILLEIVEACGFEHDEDQWPDDYSIAVNENKDSRFDWIDINMRTPIGEYSFTMHSGIKEDGRVKTRRVLSLPYSCNIRYNATQEMMIETENTKIKLPFNKEAMSDEVVRLFAKYVMFGTEITMDVMDFDQIDFPDRGCHC